LAGKQIPIAVVRTSAEESLPEGAIDFSELTSTQHVRYEDLKSSKEATADDMVFLPFSSGTTGLPKGVMLSHNNITSNCEQVQASLILDLMGPNSLFVYGGLLNLNLRLYIVIFIRALAFTGLICVCCENIRNGSV